MDSLTKFLAPTKLEKSPKPRKKGQKNLNKLKPTPPKDQKAAKEAKQRETAQLKARTWADNCDMFILQDVDVNILRARPKNTDELKSLAAQRIADMGDQLEDARSAIFKDKNGITLLLLTAFPVFRKCMGSAILDLLIKRTLEATQALHSVLQPITPERDVRHNEDDKYMVYIPDGSTSEKSERAGVTHLVQCWTMQGHPSYYYRATREVAIYLSCMFEVAYPEYHAKYTKAFKAGVWEPADPGPWIGRAIVYKLQVSEHVDGLDDGPTASFCVGDFEGGPMYLPDIGMKLSSRENPRMDGKDHGGTFADSDYGVEGN
ncbi:hypothetical protein B0H14DRAFT_2645197 [Mycena olivaceomarginata]|nr:hypothetical protein B0H14DRAFT_2645197 [Mycena olivaceomarginata]